MSNKKRKMRLGFCLVVLVVVSTSTWAEDEIILPPGSVWEYSSTEPTDPDWKTKTGGWAEGAAPFGNVSDGYGGVTDFNFNTHWPENNNLWVRIKIDLTGYDLSTIRWDLGVDNGYTLYINGNYVITENDEGYTYRWEYSGIFFRSYLIYGENVIAVSLYDHGGKTAFDMQVTGIPATAVVVDIPDPRLEAAIRKQLSHLKGPILQTDLEGLTFLDASGKGIEELTGLEYCVNLEDLRLSNNNIEDISALSPLTKLEALFLYKNNIRDISALSGLTELTHLYLYNNEIRVISALSGLKALHVLDLHSNEIRDIQPLVDNPGIDAEDFVDIVNLRDNPLSNEAIYTDIIALLDRGVNVVFYPLIEDLVKTVENLHLRSFIEEVLIARLDRAAKALERKNEQAAINHLSSFIDRCKNLAGKELKEDEAAFLILFAEDMIKAIEGV